MQTPEPTGRITTTLKLGGQSFDADRFSEVAHLQPTEIWHPKNKFVKNNPNFAQICWIYSLVKRPHWSIDAAIGEILDPFEPRRSEIVAFAQENKCSLHVRCRIYGDETVIIYNIEHATIERLAAFGCEISFLVEPILSHSLSRTHDRPKI